MRKTVFLTYLPKYNKFNSYIYVVELDTCCYGVFSYLHEPSYTHLAYHMTKYDLYHQVYVRADTSVVVIVPVLSTYPVEMLQNEVHQ